MAPEYLLFLDTETTGLPARWDRPYAEKQAWPYVAQLGWVIYTEAGELVKSNKAYLQIPPGSMPASATAIHGLTSEFMRIHGRDPKAVLRLLRRDLATYSPRVIGHFLQLDFHVLGAAFLRAELDNPLLELPQFCTMQPAWPSLKGKPAQRHWRLQELHELLFNEPLERLHDAYIDALATARCFFELRRRGLITPELMASQPRLTEPLDQAKPRPFRWLFLLAAVGSFPLLAWLVYG
ncbi:3'-5' exonuclease [Hymenobacter sp. BT730]|uniref:3'-5' exonuclease n=1 Tax=Hymenobacter sp. BT730 TaxID=3063332 RepID=UPI0026E0E8F7|nr:3'-5' exonuclease [Hymenobacter sp. BT730]